MKTIQLVKYCLVAASLFVGVGSMKATAQSSDLEISGLSLDSYISGPLVFSEDLEGKVIFFEYWGRNCPPCIASLPHLRDLYNKFGGTGKFMIIGAHSQSREDGQIKELLTKNKISYPNFQSARVTQAPCPGGIPYGVLIDHNGNVVKKGSPSSLYQDVAKLVAKVPAKVHPIFGSPKVRYYGTTIKGILPGKDSSKGLAKLKEDSESKTGAQGEEAKQLLETYQTWYEGRKKLINLRSAMFPAIAYKYLYALNQMTPEEPIEVASLADLNVKHCMEINKLYKSYNDIMSQQYVKSGSGIALKKLAKRVQTMSKTKDLAEPLKEELDRLLEIIGKNN